MTNGIMSYALTNMLANKLAADNTGTSGTYNAYSGSGIFRMSNINPNAEVGKRTEYEYLIGKAAEKYGVNETLIKAIMKAESDFDPECVSKAGAVGLMQLMPETAKVMGVTNSYDEEQNINGGVGYFKKQLDAYGGDVKMALAAYNCGPTRLRNLGITSLEDPADFAKLPAETRNYVNKIINSIK
ncbi:MAG: lytic transglycosylase domain-containing protein [Oscillospiraceae bacterium]|nr:lytic transglycosylase domain-containing protein [Oscillospiraceae bacterium]